MNEETFVSVELRVPAIKLKGVAMSVTEQYEPLLREALVEIQ